MRVKQETAGLEDEAARARKIDQIKEEIAAAGHPRGCSVPGA